MIIITNIVHAQTVLLEDTLEKLKEKSRKQNTKDALSVAVDHYLACSADEMRDALKAAQQYIAVKNMGSAGTEGEGIQKQISKALEEK